MSSIAYIMQWGDHKTNVHNHLRVLFEEQKFVDLTLFCSTHSVKVHSVVIASNSSYFEKVLLSQNGVNSVIVLKDMKFEVLRALIEFMYCGETTVLDEDVDALLYASKKFEVKGLSRMTRQGVVFSAAEKAENETTEPNHRFIFPAESAHPGMIQAVIDLTKKKDETQTLTENKVDSLYFKKTAFQRRGRAGNHETLGFSETAMSDTEYAILKEAEESRKALEKLQKYVLNPGGVNAGPRLLTTDNPFLKMNKNQTKQDQQSTKSQDHSYSNFKHSIEDEIAAENLSNELNQQTQQLNQQSKTHPPQPNRNQQSFQQPQPQQILQDSRSQQLQQHPIYKMLQNNQGNVLESTVLPTDVPIFVDDGHGNYVTLDVEMANMIAGQEIKYNLIQGVVMTSDGKGSQHSNPANILIPETQPQLHSMPILNCEEIEFPKLDMSTHGLNSSLAEDDKFLDFENVTLGENNSTKRKPFVVKEIIKLKQPQKTTPIFGGGQTTNAQDGRFESEDYREEYCEIDEESEAAGWARIR